MIASVVRRQMKLKNERVSPSTLSGPGSNRNQGICIEACWALSPEALLFRECVLPRMARPGWRRLVRCPTASPTLLECRFRPSPISMSPSRSFWCLTLRSCRTCLRAARLSTFGLPTSSSAAFFATIRLRRRTSTMPPAPQPPADRARYKTQKMAATELVGQSGSRYVIDRVLQEKGIPPRRVYLATYVLLKLNCQHHLTW